MCSTPLQLLKLKSTLAAAAAEQRCGCCSVLYLAFLGHLMQNALAYFPEKTG